MNEQLIKASQDLSECEGMDKSPWMLVEYEVKHGTFEEPYSVNEIQITTNEGFVLCKAAAERIVSSHPYLTSGHFDKWSSAKILQRAGWDASINGLSQWITLILIDKCLYDEDLDDQRDYIFEEIKVIIKALKEGNHELAYILAIILLYKIDREAYDKGMAPLLEEG